MGTEAGTCWNEHWVLYGNQFDNKFHIKKKKKERQLSRRNSYIFLSGFYLVLLYESMLHWFKIANHRVHNHHQKVPRAFPRPIFLKKRLLVEELTERLVKGWKENLSPNCVVFREL